ncbi:non-hydrolyzing UDP-N-acetylglucosamine 2-epimerase [Desulfobotulus sp.]|uniref:non-hydrolyzing UDP-N-acetylglucosamine 2-epimerase n=1 Tax=Desulfobotulus sp. TaxID=1940337 RepID=UPI002A35E1ED|nr:UDP-N-acetylglucosamine 2-epimerase (non-hydrolyzing) [Desulfobotulus sp.]MDY0162975.1 UDP-N-acetylglucosamine 2-epimerase (non-hydrolyzing) [Desulfobotulus sp.]
MRILLVFGTRPEAIKMAPLVHVLRRKKELEIRVCVTAQHREMLDQVLEVFGIEPDQDLNLMRPGQGLVELTRSILAGMQGVLEAEKPDLVLVHGDTTTAFASSLAAFYGQIPVGHVEAGLRTGNIRSPYPEELNRQMISRIADWHFAPTDKNAASLVAEGTPEGRILITGNTVVDALLWMKERLVCDGGVRDAARREIAAAGWEKRDEARPFILITGHRRENFGQGFVDICKAIRRIGEAYPGLDLVYPVHLNPRVQGPVHAALEGLENVHCIRPLGYPAFVLLMMECFLILTDSGGIQEEAPSLGKPTIVMREKTERTEALEAGTVLLSGTDPERIFSAVDRLLQDPVFYQQMAERPNPYGDGRASETIAHFLVERSRWEKESCAGKNFSETAL